MYTEAALECFVRVRAVFGGVLLISFILFRINGNSWRCLIEVCHGLVSLFLFPGVETLTHSLRTSDTAPDRHCTAIHFTSNTGCDTPLPDTSVITATAMSVWIVLYI